MPAISNKSNFRYGLRSSRFMVLLVVISLLLVRASNAQLEEVFHAGDQSFRHAATVTSIALTADRQRVLTSGRDGTARLWDIKTGEEIHRFYHPAEEVWQVVLHPGGETIFTTCSDGKVRQWDIESGRVANIFDAESVVMRMAIFPDNRRFVVVGRSGHASIWDIESGKRIKRLRPKLDDVYGVDVRADGERIATCGEKGAIVWSADDGEELLTLKHGDGDVCTIKFSPDSTRIATCDNEGALRIFDAESGDLVVTNKIGKSTRVLDWSPDSKRIVISDEDIGLSVFDLNKREVIQSYKKADRKYWPVLYPKTGRRALLGSSNGLIRVSLENGEAYSAKTNARDEKPNLDRLRVLFVDQRERHVVAVDDNFSVQRFDLESGKLVRQKRLQTLNAKPERVSASANGSFLAVLRKPPMTDSDADQDVDEILVEELEIEIEIEPVELKDAVPADAIKAVEAFRPVLDREIKSAEKTYVDILYSKDQSLHKRIELATGDIESGDSMRFVDGGSKLLVRITSAHLQVWDVKTGGLHWEWFGKGETYFDVYSDPRSSYVLCCGSGTSKMLDVSSRSVLGELKISRNDTEEAAFLPGTRGLLLAESSGDETNVFFWKGRTGDRTEEYSDKKLAELVAQMSDVSYALREEAMKSLIEQGARALKMLEDVDQADAELGWRANQIRTEIRRAALPRLKAKQQLQFPNQVSSITISPSGKRFALIAGEDANAQICSGIITSDGLRITTRFTSGNSPASIQFTPDATMLHATNRNGTISVYRSGAPTLPMGE